MSLLLSVLRFTRVQNTSSHQMLLFLPAWFLLFLPGAAALAEGINRRRGLKIAYWAFTLVFAVSVRSTPLTVVDHLPLRGVREFVRPAGEVQAGVQVVELGLRDVDPVAVHAVVCHESKVGRLADSHCPR